MKQLDLITIAAIRETVRAIDPNDDDLLIGMIEGETDAGELLDELLEMEASAGAFITANKERISQLAERNARLARKQEAARAGMHKVLDAAGLRKMERAAATVSIRAVPPKVEGEGITALPEDCVKVTYSPDKTAIKARLKAGHKIDGWHMTNGGETISVRRS
jgi:hypothetical protein